MKSFRWAHTNPVSLQAQIFSAQSLQTTGWWRLGSSDHHFLGIIKHLSRITPRHWVVGPGLRGERTFLNPKIFSETNRKHFRGNSGNYRAIWSSGSSQVLSLNGIFRPCFYNELFHSDKLILIFVLLKNFGQIFNFLSGGTKSRRWKMRVFN